MIDPDVRIVFNNQLLPRWERAMDGFFEAVERQRVEDNLTEAEVTEALAAGYGSEVAGSWTEWVHS